MEDRSRWILHIKELRAEHGVSIFDAERLALSDARWRRWVEQQINNDIQCRKMALYHLRHHGSDSLIERNGDVLKVR